MSSLNRFICLPNLRLIRYASTDAAAIPKTGIIMMNMGGPSTTDQVPDYLLRIMTDRDMIQFPFMQNKLGPWIAKRRTEAVMKKYDEIGGGSPILKWTNLQGQLLCKRLDAISPDSAPHKHYVAFRYVQPFTEDAFNQMENDGVKRVVLFSQYPQYSCATSGSSFNAIYKFYKKRPFPSDIRVSIIDRWATQPLFIRTFAELIKRELGHLPRPQDAIILFSAHSLPLKAVNRGDAYPSEVGATVNAVMEALQWRYPYQLVWQSKVGPLPWLGPFTDDAIKAYVNQGKKTFVMVPIAFVNEHIETLHEMDIEYCQDLAKEVGVDRIRRVPTPNDHPLFIEALSELVVQNLNGNSPAASAKFLNCCPHCVNVNCHQSKKWFATICSK